MKKTFVFDKVENELLSIDESTVLIDTGIDAARVKEAVMKEIGSGKKQRKATIKKLFSIIAVAAAIAAAATITVQAATGAFNPAFAELFAGEPANGVFPGADLSIKSDTLDIDFLGITGDEKEFLTIYEIRKKDGSDFIDTFDTPEDYRFLSVRADMNVSENNLKKLKFDIFGGGYGSGSGVHYEFVDEKTIRAYASYYDSAGYIKGEKLTVKDRKTTAYHIDEVLYSDNSETIDGCSRFMKDNEELINQKTASFNENQSIIYLTENPIQLVVVTTTDIPLDYELSVTLNYKTIEKTFTEAKGKTFSERYTEWTVKKIKASSFGMTIDTVTDNDRTLEGFDMSNSANWTPEEMHDYMNSLTSGELEIEITMKDGTKVRGIGSSESSETDPNGKSEKSWNCSYFKEGEGSKPYTLDPEDKASITCNGTELV